MGLKCIELCAGAGGQALGLEQAGFGHLALIDDDEHCCNTLRYNRPDWRVIQADVRTVLPVLKELPPPDLLAAGLPCPPFSVAGKQLGADDERNLFPAAFEIIDALQPRAVMIENVKGFMDPVFELYRQHVRRQFRDLGYSCHWALLNASDFGVSQLRPRMVIVGLRDGMDADFSWPHPAVQPPPAVGDALLDLMQANGWKGAKAWAKKADKIAPTIVGGSKKHGGPDLGPTRARRAWLAMGVNGGTIAEHAPDPGFVGEPRLTFRMVARLHGFPDDWQFTGRKTHAYRQVGNAFPPPVAHAVAAGIAKVLNAGRASAAAK